MLKEHKFVTIEALRQFGTELTVIHPVNSTIGMVLGLLGLAFPAVATLPLTERGVFCTDADCLDGDSTRPATQRGTDRNDHSRS